MMSETDLFAAASAAHRLETHELSARIERLVAVLREHGIPLPESDPRLGASDGDHTQACVRVVAKAYDLLEAMTEFDSALAELRTLVGSGMELVGGDSWK